MKATYSDGLVTCDEQGIRIRDYTFPLAREKRISWPEIRGVQERPLTLWTGKYRIWGMGLKPVWFSCDPRRPSKAKVFVVDAGSWIKVAITPDRPDEFAKAVGERLAAP